MDGAEDVRLAVADAVLRVQHVRSVPLVRTAREDGSGRPLIVVRVGLPPQLALTEVDTVIAHVQLTAARFVPRDAVVHVEPAVAVDRSTPTEAIVIRASE